jgi:predicted ester cyclase
MACAGFTSYSVADCKKAYKHGFKADSIVSELATKTSFRGVFQGLMDGIKAKLPVDDGGMLELTAAVLDALDCDDIDERWREGRSVFDRSHLER